jgi:hypothetical protein
MSMDDLDDPNEIDVETAKLLWELCLFTDDHVMQNLLDKAKELGISLKPLIRLLKSDEGERFTESLTKRDKDEEFERTLGNHLRPLS